MHRCLPSLLLLLQLSCGVEKSAPQATARTPGPIVTPLAEDEVLDVTPPREAGRTVSLQLKNGAVPGAPGRPNVVAYIPRGFHPQQRIDVIVFLHGWWNCAENVLRSTFGSCGSGRPTRFSYDLASALDQSSKNAILLVPELSYDQPAAEPGRLQEPGMFAAFVDEALVGLKAEIGEVSLPDVGRIVLVAHSGAWVAAGAMLTNGGVWVDEVWLFDALYGPASDFETWIGNRAHASDFFDRTRRFVSVYTPDTNDETVSLADRLAQRFSGAMVDDRNGVLAPNDLRHGVVFKRSGLTHDDVPRFYFAKLLATSTLADKVL